MFRKLTIIIIFISVYVEGLFVAHAQDLGFVPGSLFVMMSMFAITTLVATSAYFRQENDGVYKLPMTTNELEALLIGDDDVVEVETPEPFTYTDALPEVVEDEAVDVEVVEDTDNDFTDTVALKLPDILEIDEIDEEALDKELKEALKETTQVPAWTEEEKVVEETDELIDALMKDVDEDGHITLDPDVKVQSYVLEESVIEDEYIPVPEEDEAESIELEDLMKTVSEELDGEIDTTKVNAVMADGKESITLEELSETAAEGLNTEDLDVNLVDEDAYDKTIAVEGERSV